MGEPILSVSGLSKHFGGVHALDEVSFDLSPGEVLALAGDNGAGSAEASASPDARSRTAGGVLPLDPLSLDDAESDGVHPPAGSAASVPPGSDAISRWACESVAPAVDISTTSHSLGEPEPPLDDAGASGDAMTVLA